MQGEAVAQFFSKFPVCVCGGGGGGSGLPGLNCQACPIFLGFIAFLFSKIFLVGAVSTPFLPLPMYDQVSPGVQGVHSQWRGWHPGTGWMSGYPR
jgi:hypothetical protein